MRTAGDVVSLLVDRRARRSAFYEAGRRVSAHYNNETVVPLPEIDTADAPAVANFVAQAIDQHGMRVFSSMPTIECPPKRPGIERSEKLAKQRRLAAYGWLENNGYNLLGRHRARHLIAYGSSPMLLTPDTKSRSVKWHRRNPLATYPAEVLPGEMVPSDLICTTMRTFRWVTDNYPEQAEGVRTLIGGKLQAELENSMVEVAEYIDNEQYLLVAIGNAGMTQLRTEAEYGIGGAVITHLTDPYTKNRMWALTLRSTENLAGCTWGINAERIGLEQSQGQMTGVLPMYQMYAKLTALDVNAVAKSIYPDTWAVIQQTGGRIIRTADGMKGVIGEIEGGTVMNLDMSPGFQAGGAIDRIERALRITGAIPAEYGGESGTNIRTDRRGQSVLSATVDFHIDEHQQILARSIQHELYVAAEIEKAYFGNERKSFYVSWGKRPGTADYVPEQVFGDSTVMLASFAFSGMSLEAQSVYTSQAVATGLLSKRSGMETNPFVTDPALEEARIITEQIRQAALSGLQSKAAAGEVPIGDLIQINKMIASGEMTFEEAYEKVQRQAQERQAEITEQGAPDIAPPGSPATMPGMETPGAGAEVPGQIAAPPDDLSNLRQVLGGLTAGRSITSGAMTGAA